MTDRASLITELSGSGLTLTRTIGAVDQLEAMTDSARVVSIGVTSNVSVDLLSTFLRKHVLLAGGRASVDMGSHDDTLTDAARYAEVGAQAMIYLPFFDNLAPGFENQIERLGADELAAREADFRARSALALKAASAVPAVYVGTFHRFTPAVDQGRPDAVEGVVARFNAVLRELADEFANVRLIDTEAIVQALGAGACFDRRFYLRSTAPYTPVFLDELARRVVLASRGFGAYFYKALVLDCDNTLWGGIVGEDLIHGIKLGPHSYPGRAYWQAQQVFLGLESNGVLLCLCSKNNAQDVDEVLSKHPDQLIRDEHIAIKKVNWTDKVSNLRAIAEELNIGLDSLVFLDDSDFECASVRAALPQVRVFQVPAQLPEYGSVLRQLREVFLAGGVSNESRSKTEQYRQRQRGAEDLAQFGSHEEYLASLQLRVELKRNATADVARISELTQKSNQFNLTTLRQTPGEIVERMKASDGCVYSLTVADRFGSAGLTGVVLVTWSSGIARIDGFLMSCRVIGRGVEFSIWPHIVRDAAARGCHALEAEFIATPKNAQVADFFERLGLPLIEEVDGLKRYRASIEEFVPAKADWIQVSYDQ